MTIIPACGSPNNQSPDITDNPQITDSTQKLIENGLENQPNEPRTKSRFPKISVSDLVEDAATSNSPRENPFPITKPAASAPDLASNDPVHEEAQPSNSDTEKTQPSDPISDDAQSDDTRPDNTSTADSDSVSIDTSSISDPTVTDPDSSSLSLAGPPSSPSLRTTTASGVSIPPATLSSPALASTSTLGPTPTKIDDIDDTNKTTTTTPTLPPPSITAIFLDGDSVSIDFNIPESTDSFEKIVRENLYQELTSNEISWEEFLDILGKEELEEEITEEQPIVNFTIEPDNFKPKILSFKVRMIFLSHQFSIKDRYIVKTLLSLYMLRENDPDLQIRIIHALSQIGDRLLIPIFGKMLTKNKNWFIRKTIVDVLKQYDSPQIIPIFKHALQTESELQVRTSMQIAIGEIQRNSRVIKPIRRAPRDEAFEKWLRTPRKPRPKSSIATTGELIDWICAQSGPRLLCNWITMETRSYKEVFNEARESVHWWVVDRFEDLNLYEYTRPAHAMYDNLTGIWDQLNLVEDISLMLDHMDQVSPQEGDDLALCSSCHEMTNVYEEYKRSTHYNNRLGIRATCSDCHVSKDYIELVEQKFAALVQLWEHFVMKSYPTTSSFEAKRPELYSEVLEFMRQRDSKECRSCHQPTQMDPEAQDIFVTKNHQKISTQGKTCVDCHAGIVHKKFEEH